MRSIYRCLIGLLLCGGLTTGATAGDVPRVLVSVKPLQLIFSEIGGNQIEVDLLLDPGASPHIYHMKPSDVARLTTADALVWVGPDLETFLPRVIQGVKPARSISLQQRPELRKALAETSQNDHRNSAGHHHDHDHDHSQGDSDAHIWLNPDLAPAIAEVAANLFGELLPQQKAVFAQRFADFRKGLEATDQANRQLLAPVRDRGFVVTHDAYGQFVDHYDLTQVGALSISPERHPGARHITDLREMLIDRKAGCILLEPQIQPRYLDTLTEGLNIRTQEVDPLGSDLKPGPGAYGRLIASLAEGVARCLQ